MAIRGDVMLLPERGVTFRIETLETFCNSSKRDTFICTHPFNTLGPVALQVRVKFRFDQRRQLHAALLVSNNHRTSSARHSVNVKTVGSMFNTVTGEFLEIWTKNLYVELRPVHEQEWNLGLDGITLETLKRGHFVRHDEMLLKWNVEVL